MPDIIGLLDAPLQAWLPPLLAIAIWGVVSAAISMGIYAKVSPQKKMQVLKVDQKQARSQLVRYDGEWDGLSVLIKKDLGLSFKLLGLTIIPFVISVVPLFLIMDGLMERYGGEYLSFGPDWMRGFEFCYIFVVLTCSIYIKIKFKIA